MNTHTNKKHWEPLLGYVTEAQAEKAFDAYYSKEKEAVSAPPQRDTPRLFEQCVIRTACKNHHCNGGYDQQKRERKACNRPIVKGERYIEYFGESAAFQSGHRHHFQCAEEQGLILPPVSQSTTNYSNTSKQK